MKVFRKTVSAVMALAMAASGAAVIQPASGFFTASQISADEASDSAFSVSLTETKVEQSSLKTLAYYKKNDLYKSTVPVDAVEDGSLDNNLVAEVKLNIDKNSGFYLGQFIFDFDKDLTFVGCANYQKNGEATVSNFKDIPGDKVSVSAAYNKVLILLKDESNNTETGEVLTLLFALPEKPAADKAYKIGFSASTKMVPWDEASARTLQSKDGSITVVSSGDTPAPAGKGLKGDFDLDGKVKQIDATYMLRFLLESSIDTSRSKEDIYYDMVKENIREDLKNESKESLFAMANGNADVDGSESGKSFKQSDATFILRALLQSSDINDAFWTEFFKA